MVETSFKYISTITTGLEAVATILSAMKVITSSLKSLAAATEDDTYAHAEPKRGSGLGMHKWILIAGAVIGVIAIAYLENIAGNSKPKRAVHEQKHPKRVETVYVTQ